MAPPRCSSDECIAALGRAGFTPGDREFDFVLSNALVLAFAHRKGFLAEDDALREEMVAHAEALLRRFWAERKAWRARLGAGRVRRELRGLRRQVVAEGGLRLRLGRRPRDLASNLWLRFSP